MRFKRTVGAWPILLVLPFTRLIHMVSVPLQYLFRSPQKVVWNNPELQQSGGRRPSHTGVTPSF
ncbi:MAG: respiratory nitrate reductase subunit gamma [bacterium]|nr:respiratory nitrate reductase subunit gamma [bacterium]